MSAAPEPLPPLVNPIPCRKCSCSGLYIDYDPRVTSGGVKVDCPACKGRGWVEKEASS